MHTDPLILLRDAASADWLRFEHPRRVITAAQPGQVLPALEEIETLVEKHSWYAAGFLGYEAAPAFDEALPVRSASAQDFPLLWFGLYDPPSRMAQPPARQGDYRLDPWTPSIAREAYQAAIARIRAEIARGNTYQVNYTFRLASRFSGQPWSLFVDMLRAQPVGYPAYVDLGRQVLCCASPELFFRLDGQRLTCRPMKGTARRGRNSAEDRAQADWLRNSAKNRAENVMIVDMLRNDLGRIARTGSVRVPELFNVERYRTLWQMTSTVSAESEAGFAKIMSALFPSASITGAPRVSTMRLIAQLESTPRNVYTGAIGFLAPGRQAQFNVAIRCVSIDRESGRAEYGLGGGIVWDSASQDEYAEALLKAQILSDPGPEFSLLETLRWSPGEGFALREAHLARLQDSADYFDFPFERERIEAGLEQAVRGAAGPLRVRLLLDSGGGLSCQAFALEVGGRTLRVALARDPVSSQDIYLFHKTTRRTVYEQARAAQPDHDDVILYNERGELTEATVANLVVELDGQLLTPPLDCGLLAGTLRASLLARGEVREQVLRREDLARCTKIFLVNSVRGWQAAELS